VKNARWSISLQEAEDGLESIAEFQVDIIGHNLREYQEKWGKLAMMAEMD